MAILYRFARALPWRYVNEHRRRRPPKSEDQLAEVLERFDHISLRRAQVEEDILISA
jgi:hypothetical protein